MGVGVHKAYLSSEISGALGPQKFLHHTAPVFHGPVKEPCPVRAQKIISDKFQVTFRLILCKEVIYNCMDHWKKPERNPGCLIPRVQKILHPAFRFKVRKPCNDPFDKQEAPEVILDLLGPIKKHAGALLHAERIKGHGHRPQRLVVQGYSPCAAEILPHGRIKRLHGVIPVPVSIGSQSSSWDHPS